MGDALSLPVQWTASDYRWRIELPGTGHSSPVVAGGRVFVTSAQEKEGSLVVSAFHCADGKKAWQREFPLKTYKKNKLNSYASATPALDADQLYVPLVTPDQYLMLALAQSDGHEVWRHDLGPFEAGHGFGASPIVFADTVIAVNEQDGPSSVVALDRRTGQPRWTMPRRTDKAAYATPCIFQPDGGAEQLILVSSAHGVASLDPRTGKENWELPLITHRVVASPLTACGMVFAASGGGGAGKQFLAVRPGDANKGVKAEVAYEVKESLPYVPISVSDGQRVFLFGDQGILTCIAAADGRVVWRQRTTAKYFGSPIRVGDRIYCITREGQANVIATADSYKLLGQSDLGEPSQSTPAVADGVMYLRTLSHLMALGKKPGQ